MADELFEGIEEPRRSWCLLRYKELVEWLDCHHGQGSLARERAALQRIAGLESLLNQRDGYA